MCHSVPPALVSQYSSSLSLGLAFVVRVFYQSPILQCKTKPEDSQSVQSKPFYYEILLRDFKQRSENCCIYTAKKVHLFL